MQTGNRARIGGVAVALLMLAACGSGGEKGVGAPNGDILANALVPADAGAPPVAAGNDSLPGVDSAAVSASLPVPGWFGRWNGPEGLFLDVGRHPGGLPRVQLTIKADLDSTGTPYLGHVEGDAIRFTRDGAEQTIHLGTGPETGFKWLADKKDCLIVVPGKEGYCRD